MLFKLNAVGKNIDNEKFFNLNLYFDSERFKIFSELKEHNKFIKKYPYIEQKPYTNLRTGFPYILKIYLGNACNFNCKYCRQSSHDKKKHRTKEELDNFIKTIHESIDITNLEDIEYWGGEPLLYWNEIKYLSENFKFNKKISYKITTNGSLITNEIANYLIENKFKIVLSHDGPGQILRGDDPFDFPNAKELWRKVYFALNKLGLFSINNLITEQSHNFQDILEYHQNIFDKDILFNKMEAVISYTDNANEINRTYSSNFSDDWFASLCKSDDYERVAQYRSWFDMFLSRLKDNNYILNRYCSRCTEYIKHSVCVDLNYNIVPCQVFGDTNISLGKLTKTYLQDINEKLPMYMKDRYKCNYCIVAPVCHGLCPYLEEKYAEQDCATKFQYNYAIFRYFIFKLFGVIIVNYEEVMS